jgi:hypothetical protein
MGICGIVKDFLKVTQKGKGNQAYKVEAGPGSQAGVVYWRGC